MLKQPNPQDYAGLSQTYLQTDLFFEAVKTLVDKLHGETPPKRVDLSAHLIRREDLDKPDVKKLLSPELDKYLK